jgi:hypothetical protein
VTRPHCRYVDATIADGIHSARLPAVADIVPLSAQDLNQISSDRLTPKLTEQGIGR